MDTKSLLESLEQDVAKLEEEYLPLREQAADFDGTPEYKEYMAVMNMEGASKEAVAVVLQEKFPAQYEMYEKMARLEEKHASFYEVARSTATKLYGEINITVERIEKRIETVKEYLGELDKEIEAKQKEIEEFKTSAEYKAGDEKTLLVAGKMEKELKALLEDKEEVAGKIEGLTKAVERLKQEQEELVEEYGEGVKNAPSGQEEQDKEEKDPEQSGQPEEEKGDSNAQDKQSKSKSSQSVTYPNQERPAELNSEEKAKKEQEEKDKKEKEDFDGLVARVKSGKLEDKDLDKLAEIMQDPKKYDKFGITTGLVFNKSKGLLLAMGRGIDGSGIKSWKDLKKIMDNPEEPIAGEEKLKAIVAKDRDSLTEAEQTEWDKAQGNLKKYTALRNSLQTYSNVSKDRMKQKWSWLIEFEEDKKEALPVGHQPAPTKKTNLGDELGAQTVPDEEYKDVKPEARTNEQPEKTI